MPGVGAGADDVGRPQRQIGVRVVDDGIGRASGPLGRLRKGHRRRALLGQLRRPFRAGDVGRGEDARALANVVEENRARQEADGVALDEGRGDLLGGQSVSRQEELRLGPREGDVGEAAGLGVFVRGDVGAQESAVGQGGVELLGKVARAESGKVRTVGPEGEREDGGVRGP